MPHELFGAAVVRPGPRRPLRRVLTICSVALHVVVVGAIAVAQLLAVGPLPTPRSPLTYSVVHLVELPQIDVAPARPPAATAAAATVSPDAAPLDSPEAIRSETGNENRHLAAVHANIVAAVEGGGSALTGLVLGGERIPPPPPPVPAPQKPMRLHSGITEPRKVIDVSPAYPALAQASRIQGVVILEATIGVTGNVDAVQVLRSIALLDQAAVDAVTRWRYTPALLNGVPVPVIMSVTVNFRLDR